MKAFINDNKIVMLQDMSEEDVDKIRHLFQQVIDTSIFARDVKIGWIYEKGDCYPDIKSVTPRQIRQAWILSGKNLTEIEIAIDSLSEPYRSLARAEWEYSTLVFRRNKLVDMLAAANGYGADELDALWIFAGTL